MSWIPYGIFLLLTGFLLYRHRFFHLPGLPRRASLYFFALKLLAGVAIWYVYTVYYPQREYADIWKYFDDSEVMYNALAERPGDYFRMMSGIGIDENIQQTYFNKMQHWDQQFENNLFNDSHTIIRFNALLRLISGGNYHTHSLFMCLLAFIGLCALYHWVNKFLWHWKYAVAFILFVSPSLLFWSSGVLKEGILFFSAGLIIYHSWKFVDDRKKYRLLWITIAVLLLAMTKLYMLVFLFPPLLLGLHLIKSPRFAFLKCGALFIVLIGIGFGIHKAKPALSPFRIIAAKQNDFLNLARGGLYLVNDKVVAFIPPDRRHIVGQIDGEHYYIAGGASFIYWNIADDFKDTLIATERDTMTGFKILSETPVAGSLMNVNTLQPTAQSVLKESPAALWRSIVRPYPWELKPVMVIPPMLENLFLYFLVLLLFIAPKKPSSKALFWFCIAYAILALTVTGLTTPVLGALVRYRITAIPFLMFAVLLCVDRQKLEKKFPSLFRLAQV